MLRQERVEFGEKLFVCTAAVSLATELILTCVLVVLSFTWVGLLYGALCSLLILLLTHRLYKGVPQARTWALGWFGLQLLLFAAALVAILALHRSDLLRPISFYAPWAAVVKVVVYGLLTWALVASVNVRAFLFDREVKSGAVIPPKGWDAEATEEAEPPPPHEPGQPLPLPAAQADALRGGANLLLAAGACSVVLGLVLFAVAAAAERRSDRVSVVLEGVAAAAFGVVLLLSAGPVKTAANAEEPTTGDLHTSARCLTWLALLQGLAAVVAAVAVALSLAAKLR
jgi:hypothetical protein